MLVPVKTVGNDQVHIDIEQTATVADLKEAVCAQRPGVVCVGVLTRVEVLYMQVQNFCTCKCMRKKCVGSMITHLFVVSDRVAAC